jgi:hypothetical protein
MSAPPLGTGVSITLDVGKDPWVDLAQELQLAPEGELERVGFLPGGMASGRTSVSMVIKLETGQRIFAQTSLRLLQAIAAAARGRYGEEE